MSDCRAQLPNFIIPGAPKCGTTALFEYLRTHPQVHMSVPKEPNYFAQELRPDAPMTWERYQSLFTNATPAAKAVGEASTLYLMSQNAIDRIERSLNEPRYIVCLRHPVDLAASLHRERLVQGLENVTDFERAWALQGARACGEVSLPVHCPHRMHVLHGESARVGVQLERLFQKVPRERCLVVRLEELAESPALSYRRVLQFLELDDDGRCEFDVVRAASVRRWPIVHAGVRGLAKLKGRLGVGYTGESLNAFYDRLTLTRTTKSRLRPEFLRELEDYFADEVRLAEELIGAKLTCSECA